MRQIWEHEHRHSSGHLIEYKGHAIKDVGKALDKAVENAGLPYRVCMYDIRHLWITTMLDQGVEPSTIADLAGTSGKMIVANYYEPRGAKDRAVSMLPSLFEEQPEEQKKIAHISGVKRRSS